MGSLSNSILEIGPKPPRKTRRNQSQSLSCGVLPAWGLGIRAAEASPTSGAFEGHRGLHPVSGDIGDRSPGRHRTRRRVRWGFVARLVRTRLARGMSASDKRPANRGIPLSGSKPSLHDHHDVVRAPITDLPQPCRALGTVTAQGAELKLGTEPAPSARLGNLPPMLRVRIVFVTGSSQTSGRYADG
jgi:hypothetical protein